MASDTNCVRDTVRALRLTPQPKAPARHGWTVARSRRLRLGVKLVRNNLKAPMSPDDIEFDQRHIWHPYSSMIGRPSMYPVVSARGSRITLADGRELIDGMASWWSVIHGYNHPHITAAAHRQLDTMSHVMFGGLTHQPGIDLCRRLVDVTATELETVFLCDSGSVSVEVAIKMAIQYWQARGETRKQRLLTVRGGYHGDTFAAMSVCDPVKGMHAMFRDVLPQHFFAPMPRVEFGEPWNVADIAELALLLLDHHDEIAAVIIEPVIQGAGGMRFYSPHYLRALRALCDEHRVLLILDEIATGFGRTGKLFAYEHAEIAPDILCLGKSLTGGYLSLAGTMSTRHIADVVSNEGAGIFMHGPTFMANPLAAAIAVASLELLDGGNWRQDVQRIESGLRRGLDACRELSAVHDVRVLGAVGVVELHEPVDMRVVQPQFVERGVWIRPFGKLVYVMPPYVTTDDELAELTTAMRKVVGMIGV